MLFRSVTGHWPVARGTSSLAVEIPTVGCVPLRVGKDVRNFDASVHGSQRHRLVVEGGTPLIVDGSWVREVWFASVLALFPASDDALYGASGLVTRVLFVECGGFVGFLSGLLAS